MATILVACDSFKNCFSSNEINSFIGEFWKQLNPIDNIGMQAVGDGGEGSLAAVQPHLNAHEVTCYVKDPLFREKEAKFLLSNQTAFIEMARASGLELVLESERSCLHSSSYGTGQLIKCAIMLGAKDIFLFIGGSATHDIGFGMAEALGFHFFSDKNEIKNITPENIPHITRIEDIHAREYLRPVRVTILCDVNNPLTGENGAANVYSQQKGADQDEQNLLEEISIKASQLIKLNNQMAGTGAAGGLAYGAKYFLNAETKSGAQYLLSLTNLEGFIKDADLVITGEGTIDDQSVHGKLISGIGRIAKKYNKPCIGLCAVNRLQNISKEDLNLTKVYPLFKQPQKKIDIAETILRLEETITQMVQEWKTE